MILFKNFLMKNLIRSLQPLKFCIKCLESLQEIFFEKSQWFKYVTSLIDLKQLNNISTKNILPQSKRREIFLKTEQFRISSFF